MMTKIKVAPVVAPVKVKPPRTQKGRLLAVAYDVLRLMRYMDVERGYGYIKAPPHSARSPYDREYYLPEDIDSADKLQKSIPRVAKQCRVCAQGAMVLAYVHLYDGVEKLPSNDDVSAMVFGFAGRSQGRAIEKAFEGGETESLSAIIPLRKITDPKKRLRWIMKRIIANGGEFKLKEEEIERT
jgi:hypothetical protein